MNRTVFFNLLAIAKEKSGKSTNTVSFDLRMQWSTLRRFEKGNNNSNMQKIFDYLQVINSHIQTYVMYSTAFLNQKKQY